MPSFPALRRQDSSGSSTAPSSASTPIEHVSHAPKIDGSEAAFIVLVVALATIVIASSAAIYILLRYGEPSTADRAARRRYSIRRRGVRSHPIPIGLPGSLSETISSVFKGRRAGAGWVPARDDDDDDDIHGRGDAGVGEWGAAGEPMREREMDRPGDLDNDDNNDSEYPRVGVTPASRLTALTFTDATTAGTHKSREATHVDPGAESSAGFPVPVPVPTNQAEPAATPSKAVIVLPPAPVSTQVPDEEWLNAGKFSRSSVSGGGGADSNDGSVGIPSMRYYHAPQPHHADPGQEIPHFASSTRFREDI